MSPAWSWASLECGSCHFYELAKLFESARVARSNPGPDLALTSDSALRFCNGHSRLDQIGRRAGGATPCSSETVKQHLFSGILVVPDDTFSYLQPSQRNRFF